MGAAASIAFGNLSLGLSLLAFSLSLLVNSKKLYSRIDRVLGCGNRAYFIVQIAFLLGMFLLKATFFPLNFLDIFLALSATALIGTFFLASETPKTAWRVEPYRKQWAVIGYTQTLNIYAALIAATTIYRMLAHAPTAGEIVLCVGLAIGIFTVIVRCLFEVVLHNRPPLFRAFDKLLIPATMLPIAAGAVIIVVEKLF
ncbi:hypothetical protein [Lysinibacter sp. HNR]|uniref:hypothetical protein n=1 Tax=Lysinibacter sp. HNR TaxID=3031408 RepID=UPI002435AAB1|nr:hypothetical protein [Lysinibacter sp. HNR]WGD37548.1 hypothetical protein FrondiHNR_01090 [Lysinibacter sp. HNR]